MIQRITASALCLGCVLWAQVVIADTVILKNGDVLNGRVVSLDASELTFQSSVLGQVALARDNVVTIHLGDQPPEKTATPAAQTGGGPAVQTAPGMLPEGMVLPKDASVEDVVRQLQLGGVDAGTLEGLQDKLPLLAAPEVKAYFGEKVSGLMSGKLTVQDIRKDAINARDQIRDLQRDLGPQADALNPYLSILESFIRKTEPMTPIRPDSDQPAEASPPAP